MRSSERRPSVTHAACCADSAASMAATGAASLSLGVRPSRAPRVRTTLFVLFSACWLFAGCASRGVSIRAGGARGTVDRTLGQSNVSPVHHARMRSQRSEIAYGLIMFIAPQPSANVRHRRFPFAETTELGGCSVSSLNPKDVVLNVCPECERFEKAWYDAHPK